MSNVHRIMWLDQEIRQRKYPNCRKLAEHFEISLRQANRDLEYLRSSLNAPISYVAVKRGFIYDDMTFLLPNLLITDREKEVLSFLAYKYNNFDGNENSQRIANLFRSLSDFENSDHIHPVFSINNDKILLFHTLNYCINNSNKIDVSYIVPGGELVNLTLHPYTLYGKSDNDYLIAYCEEYEDFAIFRLDRFKEWADSANTFIKNNCYKPDKYIGHMRKKPFRAVLHTNDSKVRINNMGDKLTRLEEGLYEVAFYDVNQLIRDLIISNQWDEIKSPSWLKDKLKNYCKKIYDKL